MLLLKRLESLPHTYALTFTYHLNDREWIQVNSPENAGPKHKAECATPWQVQQPWQKCGLLDKKAAQKDEDTPGPAVGTQV